MRKYIELSVLIDEIENGLKTEDKGTLIYYVLQAMINELKNIPAADVVSKSLYEQIKYERDIAMEQLHESGITFGAEIKRGEWLKEKWTQTDQHICSLCHSTVRVHPQSVQYKYCPYCGARMDGGKE